MRRILVPLLLLAFAAAGQPALAAGAKEGAPGTNVEMPFLIAPMSKDGKLLGYTYITSKIVASSQSAAIDVREKLAFIQDAFVRDVNGEPIGKADDPTAVDKVVLNDRLVATARRIMGNDDVVSLVFIAVQFAPLHPGDSTLNLAPPSGSATGADAAAPAPTQDQNKGQTDASTAASSPATSKPAQDATH
ncbi:MAG: hypothetical protein ABSD21_10440 [Rhizomicrobium sp.]